MTYWAPITVCVVPHVEWRGLTACIEYDLLGAYYRVYNMDTETGARQVIQGGHD